MQLLDFSDVKESRISFGWWCRHSRLLRLTVSHEQLATRILMVLVMRRKPGLKSVTLGDLDGSGTAGIRAVLFRLLCLRAPARPIREEDIPTDSEWYPPCSLFHPQRLPSLLLPHHVPPFLGSPRSPISCCSLPVNCFYLSLPKLQGTSGWQNWSCPSHLLSRWPGVTWFGRLPDSGEIHMHQALTYVPTQPSSRKLRPNRMR